MRNLLAVSVALGVASVACAPGTGSQIAAVDIGAPCTVPAPGDGQGFLASEVYVDPSNLGCRSHECIVYHWDSTTDPQVQSLHSFCTCHCSGPPEQRCDCPSGFSCTPSLPGDEPISGSYCVRSEIALPPTTSP